MENKDFYNRGIQTVVVGIIAFVMFFIVLRETLYEAMYFSVGLALLVYFIYHPFMKYVYPNNVRFLSAGTVKAFVQVIKTKLSIWFLVIAVLYAILGVYLFELQ